MEDVSSCPEAFCEHRAVMMVSNPDVLIGKVLLLQLRECRERALHDEGRRCPMPHKKSRAWKQHGGNGQRNVPCKIRS